MRLALKVSLLGAFMAMLSGCTQENAAPVVSMGPDALELHTIHPLHAEDHPLQSIRLTFVQPMDDEAPAEASTFKKPHHASGHGAVVVSKSNKMAPLKIAPEPQAVKPLAPVVPERPATVAPAKKAAPLMAAPAPKPKPVVVPPKPVVQAPVLSQKPTPIPSQKPAPIVAPTPVLPPAKVIVPPAPVPPVVPETKPVAVTPPPALAAESAKISSENQALSVPTPVVVPPKDAPVPAASMQWIWPLKSPSSYQSVQDGLDLDAPLDDTVLAMASGTVVYLGPGVMGYGQMLMIKHPQGYLSVYANIDKSLVAQGASVSQGQSIAWVGKSPAGKVVLHVEIRQDGTPQSVLTLLPKKN